MWFVAVAPSAFALMAVRRHRVAAELSELKGEGFDDIRAGYDRAMADGSWPVPPSMQAPRKRSRALRAA